MPRRDSDGSTLKLKKPSRLQAFFATNRHLGLRVSVDAIAKNSRVSVSIEKPLSSNGGLNNQFLNEDFFGLFWCDDAALTAREYVDATWPHSARRGC
jgi:hypothetical protein